MSRYRKEGEIRRRDIVSLDLIDAPDPSSLRHPAPLPFFPLSLARRGPRTGGLSGSAYFTAPYLDWVEFL
jgi:hypothetical protein